jgi:vacuolar-type H+-ATPase subunit H
MTEPSEHSDFMKTVDEIKLAEQESDEILKAAKMNADKILRKAKEDVQRQKAEQDEKVVSMKNSLLDDGSKEIEKEVQKTLKEAGNKAEKVRKATLAKKDVDKLVKEFLTVNE